MKIHRYHLVHAVVMAAAFGLTAPMAQAAERDPNAVRNSGPTVTIVERSAFDWGDAGVGAACAFGVMLVASGLVLVRRHSPAGGQRSEAHRG